MSIAYTQTRRDPVLFFAHALLPGELSTEHIDKKLQKLGKPWIGSLEDPHQPILWLSFPVVPPAHLPDLNVVNVEFYIFPLLAEHFFEDVKRRKSFGPVQQGISCILEDAITKGFHPYLGFGALTKNATGHGKEFSKYYMKKAGIGDYVFKLHTADAAFGGAIDAAVLYKESAAKAGIKIEVVREPNDGYWSNVWMKKPWGTCFWSGRSTADWMFSTAYAADAKWNDTFWKHDRFNKLLKEARAMLDKKKRREMYVEMQKIVRDEGGVVVPMYADYMAAASKKLKFENPAGNWPLDGHKNTERWWFA